MLEIISICMTLIGFGERMLNMTKGSLKILRFSVFKMSIIASIIAGCTVSLFNNFGYAIFLKMQGKFEEFKLTRELNQLTQQLDEVYKKIGQGTYNKEQTEYLSGLAQQYNQRLSEIRNSIAVMEENTQKKIQFEQTLMDLTAKETDIRISAIDRLSRRGDKQFLPYLTLALLDSNEQVRQNAMIAIEQMERENSQSLNSTSVPNEINPDTAMMTNTDSLNRQTYVAGNSNNVVVYPLTTREELKPNEQFNNTGTKEESNLSEATTPYFYNEAIQQHAQRKIAVMRENYNSENQNNSTATEFEQPGHVRAKQLLNNKEAQQ